MATLFDDNTFAEYRSLMSDWHETLTTSGGSGYYRLVIMKQPLTSGCPNCLVFGTTENTTHIYNTGNTYSTGAEETISGFGDRVWNIPFDEGEQCPVCLNRGNIIAERSGEYRARVRWGGVNSPEDKYEYSRGGQTINCDVRVKVMDSSTIDEMKVASQILVDGVRCELVAEPISIGFRAPLTYVAFLKKV